MSMSQSQKSVLWIVAVLLIFAGAAVALTMILHDGPGVSGSIQPRPRLVLREDAAGQDTADDLPIEQFLPNELLNLNAADAMARNLALPVARGPNPVAPAFVAQWLGPDLADATKCLATAVYYESAGEPIAGQRAVAQVVLNRLRNPRYPKTICGVVYQGAERSTGCQFSFACDGSTRRLPTTAGWAVANAVATSVLNGVTSAEAGQSTHYHTLAVFPAWAPELAKIGIIGHHVFYRPPSRATFSYDAILKASPEADLSLPAAAVDPVPEVLQSSFGAPVSPATVNSARAASPSSQPAPQPSDVVNPGRQVVTTTARTPNSATPAAEPRRSMFPDRRGQSPNLPLVSER